MKKNNNKNNHTYIKKPIIRTGDLVPLGVKSTYCEERLDFNSTFCSIFKGLKL